MQHVYHMLARGSAFQSYSGTQMTKTPLQHVLLDCLRPKQCVPACKASFTCKAKVTQTIWSHDLTKASPCLYLLCESEYLWMTLISHRHGLCLFVVPGFMGMLCDFPSIFMKLSYGLPFSFHYSSTSKPSFLINVTFREIPPSIDFSFFLPLSLIQRTKKRVNILCSPLPILGYCSDLKFSNLYSLQLSHSILLLY